MAQYSLPSGTGFMNIVDRRAAVLNGPNNPSSTAFFNATKDLSTLDAALIAYNAAYYTQARLDGMLANDKVYALRFQADSAGLP